MRALAEELAAALHQEAATDDILRVLKNSRLIQDLELELSKALQQQTASAEVLKTISRSTFDLPTVLNDLVASALRLCNSTYGGISVREGNRLRVVAVVGSPE